ncbi:MAG: hypothetical protein R3C11_16810 [Planctomycetaceae bacterium]
MQDVTGIDLIPRLKKLNPVVQVIMLTGNTNTENIVACIERELLTCSLKQTTGHQLVL